MKKAAWVIPSFFKGSGGCRTIFQHINYMAEDYECDVYVYDVGDYRNEAQLKKAANRFYGICKCNFFLGEEINEEKQYDAVIATSWFTVESVCKYSGAAKKYYFVQDYEPMFYSVGDEYVLARNTYTQGLHVITIGKWLAWKISKDCDCATQYFDFCVDRSKYYRIENIQKEKAVCFICQPEKSRRCSKVGLEALRIVKKRFPETTIYLYGGTKKIHTDFEYVNKGIISVEDCNQLYNKCAVGLCISATNPSRIPFEMMATGLPVVDIYWENNLFDYSDEAIVLAQSDPTSIAQAIIDILENEELRQSLIASSQKFMLDRDLRYGFSQFMKILDGSDEIQTNGECVHQQYMKKPVLSENEIIEFSKSIKNKEKKSIVEILKRNYWVRQILGIKKIAGLIKS